MEATTTTESKIIKGREFMNNSVTGSLFVSATHKINAASGKPQIVKMNGKFYRVRELGKK